MSKYSGTKYSVVENYPGYLPTNEPYECNTKKEAIDHVRELVKECKEEGAKMYNGSKVNDISRSPVYMFQGCNDMPWCFEIILN